MLSERHELFFAPIEGNFRLIHITDVHFSARSKHIKSQRITEKILEKTDFYHLPDEAEQNAYAVKAICMTGDLVSRKFSDECLNDALGLMRRLRKIAPVLYSMGNHEMDLPADVRRDFLARMQGYGITVLDNRTAQLGALYFTGLTLPQAVYKNPKGGYRKLSTIDKAMVESCVGACKHHPTVLLAHTPLGYGAYADWGAEMVLSGHVHGGIVRVRDKGILSPERRFLPKYTKGRFFENGCYMNVSAGIGKMRVNNPAEVVCIDICRDPNEGGA